MHLPTLSLSCSLFLSFSVCLSFPLSLSLALPNTYFVALLLHMCAASFLTLLHFPNLPLALARHLSLCFLSISPSLSPSDSPSISPSVSLSRSLALTKHQFRNVITHACSITFDTPPSPNSLSLSRSLASSPPPSPSALSSPSSSLSVSLPPSLYLSLILSRTSSLPNTCFVALFHVHAASFLTLNHLLTTPLFLRSSTLASNFLCVLVTYAGLPRMWC